MMIKMKRILCYIVAFTLCLGMFTAMPTVNADADSKINMLYAFGLLDKTEDRAEAVSRIEMVHYAVSLYGEPRYAQGETPYADIAADNEYSGDINMAAAKGIISPSSLFYPDRTIKYEEAVKMIVSALDYAQYANFKGAYPQGFINVAAELDILDGIKANIGDGLTFETVALMLQNALKSTVCTTEYLIDENGEIVEYTYNNSKEDNSVLKRRFGVSAYNAYIREMNGTETVSAEITGKINSDSTATYKTGDICTLVLGERAQAEECKYAYCKIYITDDNVLVYAELSKNVEIIRGGLVEINKSDNLAPQNPAYIENVGFEHLEDYIDLASGCIIEHNGKRVVNNRTYPFVGGYARAVVFNDEIIALEVWELSEGGIITELDDNGFKFTRGITKGAVIPDMDKYKKKTILLNGTPAEHWALVNGTIFDYYGDSDFENLLIVASTMEITDELISLSDGKANIGGDIYKLSQKYDVYYEDQNGNFRETVNLHNLLGRTVSTHLDFSGKIRYIRASLDDKRNNEFYAIFTGYSQRGLSSPEFQAYSIDGRKIEKKIFAISERVQNTQAALITSLRNDMAAINNAGTAAEKNEALKTTSILYKVRVNAKEEIIAINAAELFEVPNLTAGGIVNSSITTTAIPYIDGGGVKVYVDDAPIVAVFYSETDGMIVKTVDWANLKGRTPSGVVFHPYAEPDSSDIDIILMRGTLDELHTGRTEYQTSGLCTEVFNGYDEKTESEVLNLKINDVIYTVKKHKDSFANITDYAYVVFSIDNPFLGENEIFVEAGPWNMSGLPSTWGTERTDTKAGLYRDEIKKIDPKRVYFESGDVWYMQQNVPVYEVLENSGNVKIVKSDRSSATEGANAWYYFNAVNEIGALFFQN